LQGLDAAWIRKVAGAYFAAKFDQAPEEKVIDLRTSWADGLATYPDGASVAAAVTSVRGRKAAVATEPVNSEQRFLKWQWQDLLGTFGNSRFVLAVALLSLRASSIVTLDLTELILSGYMEPDELPHDDVVYRMASDVAESGPVIVVAEGSSDVRWLRHALQIAAPAVAHLFRFLEFAEYRAPGGTDRVVSLTKGMASAGVMNRIVAVLDNDTAGVAAAMQLLALGLPVGVAVVTLPDVPYARDYPTLGPDGLSNADVNGRAVSIEFMFGRDVLRSSDGQHSFPVRWESWVSSVGKYQGRLSSVDKAAVAHRIEDALADGCDGAMTEEIAAGCRRLAQLLLEAARPHHMAVSEFLDVLT